MSKKKTCKRKRILNKDGSINQANVEHNKKCEKDMVKDNPWLNEKGLNEKEGEEYGEAVLGKDHELMIKIKKEIKKTKARRKRIRRNKKKQKQSKKPTKAKKKPKKQKGGAALCVPCISPVLTGLGLFGAGAGAVAGVAKAAKAGSSVIQKHSSSSSSDGKNIYRKENFELFEKTKQGKKVTDVKRKFIISQKNKKVIIHDGKEKTTDTFKTIQKASDFYNKKVVECKKEGFKKCTKRTKKFSKKKKKSK